MVFSKKLIFTISIFTNLVPLLFLSNTCFSQEWASPMVIDDSNIKLRFEVDSTWHLVKGNTSAVRGRLSMNKGDLLKGDISVPVSTFDTDSSSRDETLRESMEEEIFKEVKFEVDESTPLCKPTSIHEEIPCDGTLKGKLTIRDVTRDVLVPYEVTLVDGVYKASGSFTTQWEDYGVKDPSILISKLDPVVKIFFDITLQTA